MLRVAMISYHTCPLATLGGKDTGGMNVYVRELTRHLGEQGVHVDVFTRSQDEHVPHILHDLGYGNRVVHIASGPEHPLPKQELASYLPEFVQGIKDFAFSKGEEYNLIHSHYWMSGIAGSILKSSWHIPLIHMYHTLGMMKNRVARSETEIEGEYRIDGEKQVLADADRIVVATIAEKAQLEFLYRADPRKLSTIPPGVDVSRFYPISPDEAKAAVEIPPCKHMLLYVGRIEPLKGLETLIRAISNLKDSGALDQFPFCLTIIGGDPDAAPELISSEMARVKNLSQELGLSDLVIFLGKQDQDQLPYYYSAADIVIVPSHYESFGMVALESMACGTPVVASQVGGLGFLVQDGITGFVVPDGEPDALSERLYRLICHPELRNQMGAQAHEFAQSYSWQRIASQMINLYGQVLSS
ncbi:MAG: glycosyltransferase [Anaerolineaceae bacterium]